MALKSNWLTLLWDRESPKFNRRKLNPFCRHRLWIDALENRLTLTGNIAITGASLIDANFQTLTVVYVGEEVYVEAQWNTQNLPGSASYRVAYAVNGLTLDTPYITDGAGSSGTTGPYTYASGGFIASPGTNQVTVTIDPDNSVTETSYTDNTMSFTFNAVSPQVSGSDLSYTVAQMCAAYGINSIPNFGSTPANGSGQTIAIVDPYNAPNIFKDLDGFDQAESLTTDSMPTLYQQYGPASSILTVYNQSGQNITASIANSDSNNVPVVDPTGAWEAEETGDVEWAHAIAPGAKIDLIETDGNTLTYLLAGDSSAADLPGVSVVSNCDCFFEYDGENADDSSFVTPSGHTGVTFLAATGDSGASLAATGDTGAAYYPAFSPNVVAIGGTQLILNNNTYASETGWGFPTSSSTINFAQPDTSSFALNGMWASQSGGFGGTYGTAAGKSSASATWTAAISSAEQGWNNYTEVSATWTASPSNATDATYSIYNGATLLGTATVNQTKAPVGTADGSSQFQELGVFQPTSGTFGSLTVVLNANSADGTVVADAIGIAPAWASGGGASLYESQPAYQSGVVPASMSNLNGSAMRTTPDVSFDASLSSAANFYFNGSVYYGAEGTSLATPCWAGLIAIANQGRVAAGGMTLNNSTNPQQTLQALYSLPASDFHDIIKGYNGNSASPGYDEATGLGTPIANFLIPDLVDYGLPGTVTGVNTNTGPTTGGTTVTIIGTNFIGVSAVIFGTTKATNFTVVSNTQITAIDPAGAVGTVDVTVATAGGTTATTVADEFTYKAISATSPSSSVTVLPLRTSLTSFPVGWSGTAGTGGPITSYNVSISIDGGPFNSWLTTSATSATYVETLPLGYTYGFISQAQDQAGDVEPAHTTADTTITTAPYPWQNPGNPMDVLGTGGAIIPDDALQVIDYLTNNGSANVLSANFYPGSLYYDVLGLGTAVPEDALNIIDYLTTTPAISTTTTLTSTQTTSLLGQSVTFTAKVVANELSTATPVGTVTFYDGSTSLGTGTLNSGVAMFTTATLTVGTHSIQAVYDGGANTTVNCAGGNSNSVSQVVSTTAPATVLPQVSAEISLPLQAQSSVPVVSPAVIASGQASGPVNNSDPSSASASAPVVAPPAWPSQSSVKPQAASASQSAYSRSPAGAVDSLLSNPLLNWLDE